MYNQERCNFEIDCMSSTKHTCDAIVISCIDFRFQKFIRRWIDTNLTDKTFDYVGFAGGSKDLNTILNQIDISVKLHDIKQVVLLNHEDCGAYGAQGTPEKHKEDLLKAKETILEKYSNLTVNLFYLHLNGDFEEIQ